MGRRIDPRSPRRAAYKLVLALATTVVALSGCGSSSSSSGGPAVSAAAYAKSVCSAVGPFLKDVQSKVSALDLSPQHTPRQGKQALLKFISSAVGDSNRAISTLQAAGTPNVANGAMIASAVVKAFTQLKGVLLRVQGEVYNLPTSSDAAFKAAASKISPAIQTSLAGIGATLTPLKSTALEKAAKNEPACQSLSA